MLNLYICGIGAIKPVGSGFSVGRASYLISAESIEGLTQMLEDFTKRDFPAEKGWVDQNHSYSLLDPYRVKGIVDEVVNSKPEF